MERAEQKKKSSSSKRLELFLAACLYYSGLVSLARWHTRRSKKLVILCYHRMSGGYLREHMHYLKRHYRLLHLETALEELYQSPGQKYPGRDQRTDLVITSDDGYHDLYTYGLPLARELQVPITVFLLPGYVESGKNFWWQEPEHLLHVTPLKEVTFQGKNYCLNNPQEKQSLLKALDTGLRHTSSVVIQQQFLEEAYKALAVSLAGEVTVAKEILPLNWTEVRIMDADSWISFAAHTMYHPILAYLDDPAELQYEVNECRAELEKQLGHSIQAFAYPVGKNEHFEEKGYQAVKAAGYSWAVTCIHGLNSSQTDPHRLHRLIVDVDQHWLMIAAKASGLWDILVYTGRIPVVFLRNMFK
jgi:peptidoglycan/xylan/chitin deacetylase (PgdA/CDA1 family)